MRKFFVSILAIILMLVGCSTDQIGSSPQSDNSLIIGIESEADVLDPHRAGGWVTFRINSQIHESLVMEDLSASAKNSPVPPIKPGLAESWEISDDGLTYTFHLRKDVKFHDGTDFNSEAVKFNFQRLIDPSFEFYDERGAGNLTNTVSKIKEIKTVDEHTIEILLSEPFSPFIRMLSGSSTVLMLSPDALKKAGTDQYAENPVGTGPFKFAERVRGQKIVLSRNEEYWGDKAKLDQVIFRPIPEDSARVLALEAGEVDIIAVPPPDSVARLEQNGFKVDSGNPPHVWFLSFNFNNPHIQDVRVRQAIIMAIDREGMAKDLLKGTATAAYSAQSPANEAFDPNFIDYEYNPERAKELLKEAGYENGFEMIFQTSVDGSGQLVPVPMAEWIQQDLAKIGITVKLETFEWISYLGMWAAGMAENVGFNQMSWGMSTPYYLYNIAFSDSFANAGRYKSEAFDQAVLNAIAATDEAKAITYWQEANKIVADDAALVPIVNDKAPYVFASYVEGFVVPNEEWYDLTQVTVNKK